MIHPFEVCNQCFSEHSQICANITQSTLEHFHHLTKKSGILLFISPYIPLQPKATTNLLSNPIDFCILDFQMKRIIYVDFWD